tara:strand:- start:71 stop:1567 length:1497 start_codon:yes stop_codon:yes gene_type:complete
MTLTQITEKGIKDGEIINADISSDASDRIAGSKITPAFGAQNLSTTGTAATGALSVTGTIASTGNIEITNNAPGITFTDSDDSHQFYIQSNGDALNLVDATNNTTKLGISNTGHITLTGNVSVNNGYLEVADTNVYINENITHAGDGDTRIRFPAANEISFEAGGNERLKVKSTGLAFLTVDNGSDARIDVSGTSSTVGRVVATTTGFAAFTNLQLRGSQIDFANASGVSGVFDSSNRLGIGTTSPNRLIHGAGATPILKLDATNNEAYVQFNTAASGNSNESYIGLVDGNIYISTTGDNTNSTAQKLNIGKDGNLTINDGNLILADGHGINFSLNSENESGAGASTGQLLDDYEEGTWTPEFDALNQSSTTFGLNHQKGYYTKIGNLVHVTCYLQGFADANNGGGANDDLSIIGLPFAVPALPGTGSQNRHAASFAVGSRYRMLVDDLILNAYGGGTEVRLFEHTSGNTMVRVKTNQITARGGTNEVYFAGCYRVHA